MRRFRLAPAIVAALALAACNRGMAPGAQASSDPLDAVNLPLPSPAPLASPSHAPDEKPEWRAADAGAAGFGYAGERAQLSVACRKGALVITRNVAAPVGAKALFALIGNRRILRLPVDAVPDPSGKGGYVWRGSMPAADDLSDVFMGRTFTATLPGGGEIDVTGSPVIRDLVNACRNQPAAASTAG
ncbi:hypothetical protein RXV95_05070 [Novosphingobium sp. ZN18A2]|uniref:hypothetical protein n=1 Tax=Novosphingobium sp. ZN18A2 TaxID=3079861 RepID=UPI0030D30107